MHRGFLYSVAICLRGFLAMRAYAGIVTSLRSGEWEFISADEIRIDYR